MSADSQNLRARLLETHAEYRELSARHQELDQRLQDLASKPYLTPSEQIEATTLKKRKLQLKDRMEAIVRSHQAPAVASADNAASTSAGR
jgi:uncharacterized protein YdcH (DUF465 family)